MHMETGSTGFNLLQVFKLYKDMQLVYPKCYHIKWTVSTIFLFAGEHKDTEALPVNSQISF